MPIYRGPMKGFRQYNRYSFTKRALISPISKGSGLIFTTYSRSLMSIRLGGNQFCHFELRI